MKDTNRVSPGYYHSEECNLPDFQKIIDQKNLTAGVNSVPSKQMTHPDEISNSEIFLYDVKINFIKNTFLEIRDSNHFFK